MSSCANLLNQISAQLCQIKKRQDDASCALDIGTVQTAIFKKKDTVLNLVVDNECTKCVCGIPVKVSRTECCETTEYDGLLTLEETDCKSCVVVPATCLHKYGTRGKDGWFYFEETVPIKVNKVNLCLLKDLSLETLTAALQYVTECCRNCTVVSCEAYRLVNDLLSSYNVRLNPYQVSCFFDYLEKHQHCDGDEPAEPAEPAEPSDFCPTMTVVSKEHKIENLTPDCDIEQKLRSILEATTDTD